LFGSFSYDESGDMEGVSPVLKQINDDGEVVEVDTSTDAKD
jgi:hypothetical protein